MITDADHYNLGKVPRSCLPIKSQKQQNHNKWNNLISSPLPSMYLVSMYHKSSSYKQLHSLQLLLPNCVHFSCCFLIACLAAAPQLCPLHSCCSLTASASAAAPQLCPLQLLLPDCICFSCCSLIASALAAASRLHLHQLLLPDCICFSYCFQIASASAAAPQLHLL